MQKDKQVFDLIDKELERQRNGIELIASENFTSLQVMQAMGTVPTNKYAEGYPGKRYYGGCEIVDEIETLAIERLKKIFNASWANVQPHSGAQANAAVFLACLKPGDKVLGLDLSMGGHLTHGSPANFSGKNFQAHFYGVKKETGLVDYDQLEEVGINEFIFIVGYLGDKIRDYVNAKYPDLTAHYIHQVDRQGVGHAIDLTRNLVNNEEVFVVLGEWEKGARQSGIWWEMWNYGGF